MSENKIFTFGYGNRTNYDDLLAALEEHNISMLIDIRVKPKGWSAIWSAPKLSDFCESVGITYSSKKALGNTSGNSNWVPPSDEDAAIALSEVCDLSSEHNILLMCAEKDYKRCHRTAVSLHIQEQTGREVLHLS